MRKVAGPPGYDELAALPLLEGATRSEIEGVAGAMRLELAQAGHVLGREGEPGDVFWLVLTGRVSVTVGTSSGERLLAEAGPGSIIGELALLTGRPRTATVTAIEPCSFLCGRPDAIALLLEIPPVRARLRLLASRRLAEDVRPFRVGLRDGSELLLRPLLATDRDAIDAAIHSLSGQSIRQRFFTAGFPSESLIDYLVDIDYIGHFAWVALAPDTGRGVAVARYVRQPESNQAEMAFTTVDDFQGRGVGSLLLGALGVAAVESMVGELVAYVMEENRAMRAVFAKAGATSSFDDPGVIKVVVEPERAAGLLDADTRRVIAAAVHDVVTAASVALT